MSQPPGLGETTATITHISNNQQNKSAFVSKVKEIKSNST